MASAKSVHKPSAKRSTPSKSASIRTKKATKPATLVSAKTKPRRAKKTIERATPKRPQKAATRRAATSRALDMNAEEAFSHFLPEALRIADHEVIAFRADAQLALVNVRRGVEAVRAAADDAMLRPQHGLLHELPYLALAVTFAATRALPQDQSAQAVTNTLLARTWQLRRILLKAADACAEAGLIPNDEVDAIRKGVGAIDAAQDCVALASLYHRHEGALRGKTPVTQELLVEAATTGSQLLMLLKPAHARPDPRELASAAHERDKLWTLLTRQHELLWKLGAQLFGKSVDEHVPPLQARQLLTKRSELAAEPVEQAKQAGELVTA